MFLLAELSIGLRLEELFGRCLELSTAVVLLLIEKLLDMRNRNYYAIIPFKDSRKPKYTIFIGTQRLLERKKEINIIYPTQDPIVCAQLLEWKTERI
jgi:hypothetical protein